MPIFLRWLLNLGPTNPIAVRLVQNGSRRAKHLYIRAAYLGVLVAAMLVLLLANSSAANLSYRELASAASAAFVGISYLQIFLICVLAPVFMGGAISQEASPRTWEVLLTTPMSSGQVVLGNLLGRLFFVLSLLLASLPLFALTQYFGGVPGSAIFASYAVAGCAALLVGAIAISLAVSRLAGKRAFFAFYVCVISYLGVTWALDSFLRPSRGGGVTVVTALNPFLTLEALLNPTTYPRALPGTQAGLAGLLLESPVGVWCGGSVILSVVFLVASTISVRAGGLQTLASRSGAGVPWYRRVLGFGAAGSEHRPPRTVWQNPIAWREAAARGGTLGKAVARWTFVLLGGLFGAMLVVLFHVGRFDLPTFRLALGATVWCELAVITLVAINISATAISREREDGTLDILLTTPITASAYLRGKLRGVLSYLAPLLAVPMGTLVLAGLYVLAGGLGRSGGVTRTTQLVIPSTGNTVGVEVPAVLPEAGLLGLLAAVPFLAVCVMIGLLWSLRSKGTISSVVAAVGVVGVIAGTIGLCAWNAGAEIPMVGPALSALSPASLVGAACYPEDALRETLSRSRGGGLGVARVSLAIGALAAGVIYALVGQAIHSHMVRQFDATVRKLAGQK